MARWGAGVLALIASSFLLLIGAAPTSADTTGITLTPVNSVAAEEGAGAQFEVKITGDPDLTPVTVNFAITGNTSDVVTPGSVILTNAAPVATVTVPAVNDAIYEPGANEAFTLHVTSTPDVGSPSASGSVQDNDNAPTVASISDVSKDEGNSGPTQFRFVVTLTNPSDVATSVSYQTLADSAQSSDFSPNGLPTGTISIAAPGTQGNIDINVLGDATPEAADGCATGLDPEPGCETFFVNAGGKQARGTIVNDDAAPTLPVASVDDATVSEGIGTAHVNVTLSKPAPANGSSVNVTIGQPGTATPGADYGSSTLTVPIAAGATTGDIPIPIVNDSVDEASETLTISLSGPVRATIDDFTATITIADNDNTSSVSVNDVSVTEPANGAPPVSANFAVTLAPASERPVTVPYSVTPGTATAGSDYTAVSGTLTFAPGGPLTQTVSVPVLGDAVNEPVEAFTLTLGTPTGAKLGDGSGAGLIVDPSAPPALTISDASGSEGAGTIPVVVTLAGTPSGQNVTVSYAVQTGDNFPNASPGSDFTAASGTLTFTPGQTSKTISVAIVNDTDAESDENITVVLSNPVGATLAKAKATVKIIDNDTGSGGGGTGGGGTGGGGGGGSSTPTNPPATLPVTTPFVTPSQTTTNTSTARTLSAALTSAKVNAKLVKGRRQVTLKVTLGQNVVATVTMSQGKTKIKSSQFQLISGKRLVYVLLPKTIKKGKVSLQLVVQNTRGVKKTLTTSVKVT